MLHNLTSAAPLVPPTASSSEKAPRLWAASGVHTFLDHFYLASNQSRRHFHRENIDLCNTSTKLLICNMQFRHIAQKIDASGKCQWHIKKPCTSSPDRQTAFICCIYFVLFVLEVLVTTRQVFFKWRSFSFSFFLSCGAALPPVIYSCMRSFQLQHGSGHCIPAIQKWHTDG